MKNLILLLSILFFSPKTSACAWWDADYEYFNLFVQQSIQSPVYDPFLLTYESAYFSSEAYLNLPNENIEDWQKYFGISYENAYYLVFKSKRRDVQTLAKGGNSTDLNLKFIDNQFKKKYKQALLYLAYAKYLEPYMAVKPSGDENYFYWGDQVEHTVKELDYDKVINVLTKSWNAESDKDLKLRYAYQLVRFAHYNRKNQEAINYFKQYVESLNHKPIMYYYALDQKGGAERALGNFMQANADFFQFFTHTKNRKEEAYTSMKVTQDLDFQLLLNKANNDSEKLDLYLLLGFRQFNNPIVEMQKIIQISPNAVQAKVLMARAINQLEREMLPLDYSCPYDHESCLDNLKDKRLPIVMETEIQSFLDTVLSVSMAQSKNVNDKDFWKLTTAYLYFLKKDYSQSKQYLNQIDSNQSSLKNEKQKFEMLLDIVGQPKIDAEFEQKLFKQYKSVFVLEKREQIESDGYIYYSKNSTLDFVLDILANRYFLQKDYAKSFLLQNQITDLEYNPDLNLLNDIVNFHDKKEKNEFEKYIESRLNQSFQVKDELKNKISYDFESYVANMKGSLALANGDLNTALTEFKKVKPNFTMRAGQIAYDENWNSFYKTGIYNGYANISNAVFGFNRIECFECVESKVMQSDFLEEFPFIPKKMNKLELTQALVELKKQGQQKNEKAAKANYLIANFFFNTTTLGYFREILTFDIDNSNGPKFHGYDYYGSRNNENVFYFKNYISKPFFKDNFQLTLDFAQLALDKTKSDELKAQILFTASKAEQGNFYNAQFTDLDILALGEDYWEDNYVNGLMNIKVKKYRTKFKELNQYKQTKFYKEVKYNCQYFDYYSNHF